MKKLKSNLTQHLTLTFDRLGTDPGLLSWPSITRMQDPSGQQHKFCTLASVWQNIYFINVTIDICMNMLYRRIITIMRKRMHALML